MRRLPDRRRRRSAIPLAGAEGFAPVARRTARLRIALALVAVGLLGAVAFLSFDLRARPSSYFAAGGSGIVVVDLSTSVDPARYRRLSRVLRTIVETNQPIGLVVYSDTAYEMLPPGTRGSSCGRCCGTSSRSAGFRSPASSSPADAASASPTARGRERSVAAPGSRRGSGRRAG